MKSLGHSLRISMADRTLVYLIQSLNYYKIGMTSNLPRRLSSFKTANPNIQLIAKSKWMNRTAAIWLESSLHTKYAHKRIAGEWFELGSKDVDDLTRLFKGNKKKKLTFLQAYVIVALAVAGLLTATIICAMMVW